MSNSPSAAKPLPASTTDKSAASWPSPPAEAASAPISPAATTFPPAPQPTTPDAPTAASSTTVLPSLEAQENSADSAGKGEEPKPGGKRDFGFLPIPRRLRWDPDNPPEFTLLLNAIFGFAATFSGEFHRSEMSCVEEG